MITLGNNMELSGFNALDPASLIVVKKMIGNYAKKINDDKGDFQKLSLDLVKTEGSNNIQIVGMLDMNKTSFKSTVNDMNLFFALDKALTQLQQELK